MNDVLIENRVVISSSTNIKWYVNILARHVVVGESPRTTYVCRMVSEAGSYAEATGITPLQAEAYVWEMVYDH